MKFSFKQAIAVIVIISSLNYMKFTEIKERSIFLHLNIYKYVDYLITNSLVFQSETVTKLLLHENVNTHILLEQFIISQRNICN